MRKGDLRKLINKHFKGNMSAAACEMVILFCKKYDCAGSTACHDLYALVQEAWQRAVTEDDEYEEKMKL